MKFYGFLIAGLFSSALRIIRAVISVRMFFRGLLRFSKRCLLFSNLPNARKFSLHIFKHKNGKFTPGSLLDSIRLYKRLFVYGVSFFGLFDFDKETPEEKLITTIKRSILCIQREQYDKAEQMLHLALRMAQDQNSKDGITYVYDIMANLALEREQFDKAEVLFTDIMRRLLGDGLPDDNPKILHISSKLAHIAELKGNIEKASIGFKWTLTKIEECKRKMPDDVDVKELWALTTNWFGQLLMKENNFKEAKQCFKDAYDCFKELHGVNNGEAVTLLNNLSVACTNLQHFDEAKRYIITALNIVKTLSDVAQEGTLLANLGLIYFKEGLIEEAKTFCSQAWKASKAQNNAAAIHEAEYCLAEIKAYSQR